MKAGLVPISRPSIKMKSYSGALLVRGAKSGVARPGFVSGRGCVLDATRAWIPPIPKTQQNVRYIGHMS
eukprot:TRINITY_DN3241_c0_g1_i1.p1 TRINITY_DN3241_c0_g1~~TRINITY_DN3241_c0_g1_i1.p1  ORF type:complete len:76 (-),score=8.51 TRINITY_DN3241_c0_g1_i1:155-361(-)